MSTEIVPVAIKVVKQLARKRTLAATMIAIFLYIVFGQWPVLTVLTVAVLTVLATLTAAVIEAQKIKKPSPLDYSLIASMEREVWGETFEHAGAPVARTLGLVHSSARDLLGPIPPGCAPRRTNCIGCGTPRAPYRGRCPGCYLQWMRTRA